MPSFVSAKYNPFDKLYFWHDVIDNSVISNATNNLFMAPISIIFLKQCTNYFTTHLPFLLPFSLARSPRSINEGVILLTVLNINRSQSYPSILLLCKYTNFLLQIAHGHYHNI